MAKMSLLRTLTLALASVAGVTAVGTPTSIAFEYKRDAPQTITEPPASSTAVQPAATIFPPVGSIPRDFSPKGLQQLWDIVRIFSLLLCTKTVAQQTNGV